MIITQQIENNSKQVIYYGKFFFDSKLPSSLHEEIGSEKKRTHLEKNVFFYGIDVFHTCWDRHVSNENDDFGLA